MPARPDRAPPDLAHVPLLTAHDLRAMLAVWSGRARHLFIHIPKNAGVAMRSAPELRWRLVGVHRMFLRDRDYLLALREAMGAAGQHHGIAHARLRDVKPSLRTALRPVAVVRNPWSRVVSRFRFAQMSAQQGSRFATAPTESFDAFLESRHEDGMRPFFWHRAARGWYPQTDYVTDETGRIAADILRQEYLSQDASSYFALNQPIRPRNVTTGTAGADWQSLYDKRSIQIVADWYARDIETFGFDFDTAATRNVWAGVQGV